MPKIDLIKASILTLSVSTNVNATDINATYTLEELSALSSGTPTGYKSAAQGSIESGGFDPWAASKGGNSEIYKNRIDPAAPNTPQAISNVKNTLSGNAGNSLLQDATAKMNQVASLQAQIAQRDLVLQNGINAINPAQGTLPAAVTSVKGVYGTNSGTTLLQDATNSVTTFQAQIAQRDTTIQTGINAINPAQGTLPAAVTSVKGVYGTGPGTTLLQDATNSVTTFQAQIAQRDTTIQTGINSLDPAQATLPEAVTSVKTVFGTDAGTTLLYDATGTMNQVAILQGQVAQRDLTINAAITALDTTDGQTLLGATHAVNDAVSTGGADGNRGNNVLTDVVASRDVLPHSGTGDLKARALAVGGIINNAIAEIDPAKTTLPDAFTSVLGTSANYATARNLAQSINNDYVIGTTNIPSLRNEVAILFNILQIINNSSSQIRRIEDNSLATATNVNLADIINFLRSRTSLN